MTSLFGHSVRSDVLLLCLADTVLCFLAVSGVFIWQVGLPVEQGGPLAAAITVVSGIVAGASGLYQPEAFSRARRLLSAAAVAGLLLLVMLPVLGLISPAAKDGLQNHLIGVTLAVVGAAVATRLGFTAALRAGRLGQRIAFVRGADDTPFDRASLRGEVPADRVRVALDVGPHAPLAELLAPARLR
ncbi:hypothetical protein, partial [Falsiroseomonas oryzae]|uniref:hypothetical protein n=1 Tax=Falsiroseomonas oryzae TaxID=2766473 RepID=UPI0022EA25D7